MAVLLCRADAVQPDRRAALDLATLRPRQPYDPADAIPAAARKLVADGARRDLDRALFAYNHSWAHVARVKQLARGYATRGGDWR